MRWSLTRRGRAKNGGAAAEAGVTATAEKAAEVVAVRGKLTESAAFYSILKSGKSGGGIASPLLPIQRRITERMVTSARESLHFFIPTFPKAGQLSFSKMLHFPKTAPLSPPRTNTRTIAGKPLAAG